MLQLPAQAQVLTNSKTIEDLTGTEDFEARYEVR